MTVLIPENKTEAPNSQEKVDTNVSQQKPDTNLAQQPPTLPEQKQEDPGQEDPNWRAFREARKKDRAEREIAEKRAAEKEAEVAALKAAMEAAFSKSAPTPQAYQQYYGQIPDQQEESEDERIEKKVQLAIASREAASEKARIEREHQEYPNRLMQTYPDFNHTISQDNLDYLDYHYPEVSRPLQRLHDGFDKWSDIYQAIKKFVPNSTTSKKESARADINQNKPKSMSSTGITQPGESVNRTSMQEVESRRAARYIEMQKIIKSV